MLNSIKKNILSKFICGIMLASITLSFSGGILGLSPHNMTKSKPVKSVAGISSKPSNIRKQEMAKTNQTIAANKGIKKADREETGPTRDTWTNSETKNSYYSAVTNGLTTSKPATNYTGQTRAQQPKPKPNSNVDLYLLARVIYAESRGEPLQGQVGVGAVLLNRLKDSRFPKSLPQIIFKQGEFCTVRDGQIWKTPNEEAIKAARLAAAGWDPTGGALYFYNPAKTTSRWIWSRPVVNRIGNHIFAI